MLHYSAVCKNDVILRPVLSTETENGRTDGRPNDPKT